MHSLFTPFLLVLIFGPFFLFIFYFFATFFILSSFFVPWTPSLSIKYRHGSPRRFIFFYSRPSPYSLIFCSKKYIFCSLFFFHFSLTSLDYISYFSGRTLWPCHSCCCGRDSSDNKLATGINRISIRRWPNGCCCWTTSWKSLRPTMSSTWTESLFGLMSCPRIVWSTQVLW